MRKNISLSLNKKNTPSASESGSSPTPIHGTTSASSAGWKQSKKVHRLMTKHKLIFANQLPDLDYVTTGFPELDKIVRFPRKRISEIYGLQGVGKTTLTMKSLAGLTKEKRKVLYVDVENSFNKDRAQALGVDLTRLAVAPVSILEEVADTVTENIKGFDAIVVDSVAQMVPRAEYEGEYGDALIGLKARLMGQFMRRISSDLYKSNCALIFINQLRENIAMFTAKYSTPGGMALKYAASLRIELKTTAKDRIIKGGEQIGHYVTAEITKSKIGKPKQTAKFKLLY